MAAKILQWRRESEEMKTKTKTKTNITKSGRIMKQLQLHIGECSENTELTVK